MCTYSRTCTWERIDAVQWIQQKEQMLPPNEPKYHVIMQIICNGNFEPTWSQKRDSGQDRTGGDGGGLKALLRLLQKLKPARARYLLTT